MSDNRNVLVNSLKLVEKIPPQQFVQLLRRLAISLNDREKTPFSDDEVTFLIEHFNFTPSSLDEMLSGCQYLLQQSACFSFTSDKLKQYIFDLGLGDEHIKCFCNVWLSEGEKIIESFKNRTISDYSLDSTKWTLNIGAYNKKDGYNRSTNAVLNLSVADKEPILVQFNHEQLTQFYKQIENIQQEIDKLT